MIQVENEIAVFGSDRRNRKLWRDHSPAANALFEQSELDDDLEFAAWSFATRWLRPITEAGARAYPLPFFVNFVGGELAPEIVGGAPGEDVATYLEHCPQIAFAGLNLYEGTFEEPNATMRGRLGRYRVGRNMPALTEVNSDTSPHAPRYCFISLGEFGSPLFAPWSLDVSCPRRFESYILPDGALANGAFALRDAYRAIGDAMPWVAYYAQTDRLRVFLSEVPGESFSQTEDLDGITLTVSGAGNGQAIAVRPSDSELVVLGYRCSVSFESELARWPGLKSVRFERGRWEDGEWRAKGPTRYVANQSKGSFGLGLAEPQAIRIRW